MKVQWNVRPARPEDAARIAAIYNEGIEDCDAAVEPFTRTAEDILTLMCRPRHYLYVSEWGGTVFGWAMLSPDSESQIYSGVGEARVYISRSSRSQGLGSLLLQALFEAAVTLGFHKLVGRLNFQNHASRRLCRSLGFREVGVHQRHGYVGGRWIDVVLVEKLLASAAGA